MSLNDNIKINVLERIVSSDLNNMQSMGARSLMTIMDDMLGNGTTPRDVVPGGLVISTAGANQISIGPGSLMQYSVGLTPAPGTYDSPYRLGLLLAAQNVAVPVTPGAVHYLVEARVVQSIVSEPRGIKNVTTGLFVPTVVQKIITYGIEFQLVAGTATSFPVKTGGTWIPIGGVVSLAAGGVPTSVVQAQPSWRDGASPGEQAGLHEVQAVPFGQPTTNARIRSRTPAFRDVGSIYSGWYHYFAPNISLESATYRNPAVPLVADQWFYVYIAAPQGIKPIPPAPNGGAGVLCLSNVDPIRLTSGLMTNNGILTLPAPWDVATIPVQSAVCIGAIRRNAANNGWVPSTCLDSRFNLFGDVGQYIGLGTLATDGVGPLFTNITLASPGFCPPDVQTVRLKVHIPQASGVATYGYVISVRNTGGGGPVYYSVAGSMNQGVAFQQDVYIDVPVTSCGPNFSLAVQNILGPANLPATISLIGWSF